MRYRQLTATGDSTAFSGATAFLVNTPAAVAQAVMTKLKLWMGEWFLDSSVGVPYQTKILGFNSAKSYDVAIQSVIINTPGVNQILSYSSQLVNRQLKVTATINTIYGSQPVTVSI